MTKLTNEELLTKYLAELAGDFTDTDDRDAYRAEILQRMAEGAAGEASPLDYRAIANELAEGVLEKTPRMNHSATWPGTITIAVAIMEGMKRVSGSASTAGPRPSTGKQVSCISERELIEMQIGWAEDELKTALLDQAEAQRKCQEFKRQLNEL